MKSIIFFTAASTAFLLAPGAKADSDNRRIEATRYRVAEVQKLAHEVEDRARRVHRSAERLAHHRTFREERALLRLHDLKEKARQFHRQVERYGQNFRHTESDFRELRSSYTRAAYAMHNAHAFGKVDREFDRLSDAMYDLEMYTEDLFGRGRPAHRRYRDWNYRDYRRRAQTRARVVLPRVRVSWNWLGD